MNTEILIKLLQIHFEHNRKIDELKGKINLAYLEVDLLSIVLDAVGIPADNTIEQMERCGYGAWLAQPDTFSRYWYYQEFQRWVIHGTYEECRAYLEVITTANQPGYLFELRAVELDKPAVEI